METGQRKEFLQLTFRALAPRQSNEVTRMALAFNYLTLLCDWSRQLTPSCQSIKCKTKNSRDMVIRFFPSFLALQAALVLIG